MRELCVIRVDGERKTACTIRERICLEDDLNFCIFF